MATRRNFIGGCSAAIAAMSGARINNLVFGGTDTTDHPILVNIFLRGGMDGLNCMFPRDGHPDRVHYEAARADLAVPHVDSLGLGQNFGLHPSAAGLHELFQDGYLGLIHACGLKTFTTRSHFDAMERIELGFPETNNTNTGWLSRHLTTMPNLPSQVVLPAVAMGSSDPISLFGSNMATNIGNIDDFDLNQGPFNWRSAHRTSLRQLLSNGTTQAHVAGLAALDSADIIELSVGDGYTPDNGAVYPNNSLGNSLRSIAQLIKLDLGMRVATVDYGGWDTHNGQGNGSGGTFATLVNNLSESMSNLFLDLDSSGGGRNDADRVTVVVQTEFGRRLFENSDNGTDHGYGSLMMVLGKEVNGGIHGDWPGLAGHQLFEGDDLDVATDYRRIYSEILVRRFGNQAIDTVFPGYADVYGAEGPLGVVQGTDLPVTTTIFDDDFETGATGAWSSTTV